MGCACGGTKTAKVDYVYVNPSTGQQTTYHSEIEARAAVIRNGGGSYTPINR
jgi:hypothetical protein